uniref:Uncharacterized protein n=1 Tax=Avena sativa TaxID=4498 RepID=A0ACD5UX97_AVESA
MRSTAETGTRPRTREPFLAETLKITPAPRRRRPAVRSLPRRSKMKYIAAYLLAYLSGNASPSADDLTSTLESVGCEIDSERMELLLSQVKGKDITELLAAGREKFASVPSGGGGGVAVAAAAPTSGGAAPAAESKKEEKVLEKEESDDDMGFSLFD